MNSRKTKSVTNVTTFTVEQTDQEIAELERLHRQFRNAQHKAATKVEDQIKVYEERLKQLRAIGS